MPAVIVVGMQFGDESKGAVVDYLAEWADLVVRYNGGSNAGHTVVASGEKYKLHLMPSSVVRGKRGVLGAGVAFDPEVFLGELEDLRSRGKNIDVLISLKATLLLPYHKELDSAISGGRLGTTKRGIGPAYQDKMARVTGLKVADLFSPKFPQRLKEVLKIKENELRNAGIITGSLEDYYLKLLDKAEEWRSSLSSFVGDDYLEVNEAIAEGKFVIFEGAQGTMLDVDHGTYPFVTSSNPVAGGACTGAGVSPLAIDLVVGVTKAYTTRVGKGPFPTELSGDVADYIRDKGGEYGTTTGRPRRVGWLDLPMLRYSAMINGIGYLAIRKIDVLSGLDKVKIAVAYEIDGEEVEIAPPYVDELEKAKPIYEELEGWEVDDWKEFVEGGWDSLPEEVKNYILFIEKEVKAKAVLIGVGPDREMSIPTQYLREIVSL